ncbi:UNVERIFIED_ORG: hypothetical protein ABIC97_005040 [Peribacillus simplex]
MYFSMFSTKTPLELVTNLETKKHGVRRGFLLHHAFFVLFTMHFEFQKEFIVTG